MKQILRRLEAASRRALGVGAGAILVALSATSVGAMQDVVVISEYAGNAVFLDAAAADPDQAVIAVVPLDKVAARTVATSPDGAIAAIAHDKQGGSSWVSVIDVHAVLDDVDPSNDLLGTVAIPTNPSLGGFNVNQITGVDVSPDSLRLGVSLNSTSVFSNGIVYLVDIDPTSGSFLSIIDYQALNANLAGPVFRPGTNEVWISNVLTIGTSGSNPGIHVRSGVDLSPITTIPNFGPSEAFSAPGQLGVDATGAYFAVPQSFNGYFTVIDAASRTIVDQLKFGSSPNCGGSYGTSFPQRSGFSDDGATVISVLLGSRPFTFGCGTLTSAVTGVGFASFDAVGGALSSPSTLPIAGIRPANILAASTAGRSFVLSAFGVHALDVAARSEEMQYALGRCPGESLQDHGLVVSDIAAPRHDSSYDDRDHDGLADVRCDGDPPPLAVCGNGVVEAGELCDGGDCCTDECTFEPATTECRPASDLCDAAELCTGSGAACPDDEVEPATTVCRTSIDPECDGEELCDGVSVACPPDVVEADGTACDDGDAATVGETCTAGLCSCLGPDLDGDLIPDVCDPEDAPIVLGRVTAWPKKKDGGIIIGRGTLATGVLGAGDVLDLSGGFSITFTDGLAMHEVGFLEADDCETHPKNHKTRCRSDDRTVKIVFIPSRTVPGEFRFRAEIKDRLFTQPQAGPLSLTITHGDIDRSGSNGNCTVFRRKLVCWP